MRIIEIDSEELIVTYDGPPLSVQVGDYIADLEVTATGTGEHANEDATRFTLGVPGCSNVGRLIVCNSEDIVFTRGYETREQMTLEVESVQHQGFTQIPARAILAGDVLMWKDSKLVVAGASVVVNGAGEPSIIVSVKFSNTPVVFLANGPAWVKR